MNGRSDTAVSGERASAEASAVRVWRVSRLIQLGLAEAAAEVVADRVDWHDVARLVDRGCPAALAVAILN